MATAPPQHPALADVDEALATFLERCWGDPLAFVLGAYPWGQEGTSLEHETGPDTWQEEFLVNLGNEVRKRGFDGRKAVMPIRELVTKGHGVGGSVMVAWLVDWIMSTRPDSQGVVTANTNTQLETKTWSAVMRWTKLCITRDWFEVNTKRMYHKDYPESWFCTPQTCRAENSEAFAGQHAKNATSFYAFDEDSAIADIIHVVSEGGLTDGEPMIFRFGNPTRNTGDFYQCGFGKKKKRWHTTVVDSRESRFTNHELLEEWVEEHGEDSDFVRVRIRGLPPRASDIQFIPADRVDAAQKRDPVEFEDEPLIVGVDFSGGGQAYNTIRFRRGLDARSIQPIRVPGEETRQSRSAFLAKLAEILADKRPDRRVSMMFCDSAFGAAYVARLQTMGFGNVAEVNFGDPNSPDRLHCGNMRAYMYRELKEWLVYGSIDPEDRALEDDLLTPGFHLDKRDRLFIEPKESMAKRGIERPLDEADPLALTFASPVQLRGKRPKRPTPRKVFQKRRGPSSMNKGWMG